MKKVLFLILILTLALLAGCGSKEAKEPVPDWPDRITGEYDDALTFTYKGAEPEAAGTDSLTGRMTALFSLEDGGTLALGWRRLAGAETELLEDFLAEGGGVTGVWVMDSSAPSAAESYVSLEGRWYCLSASCPGMETEALLDLLDGTVSAQVREARVWPRLTGETWVSQLPWEEDWTCLDLGTCELEPESGKEALRGLLSAYSWTLAEPEAGEAEPVPEHDLSVVPRIRQTTLWTESGERLRFHLRRNGDVWWNGALWRPAGADAGEKLLAGWSALRDTGIPTESPPPLTYSCGGQALAAHIAPTYSWSYVTRAGEHRGAESDGDLYSDIEWLDGSRPVLRAEGVVRLSFPTREPDSISLTVFTELGKAPVELRDGGFVPYAGVNAYCLTAHWEKADRGGSGSANYILLVEGACAFDLPETEAGVSVSLLQADSFGCSFAVENREDRQLLIYHAGAANSGCHPVFRRTDFGGWEWVKPIWPPENVFWHCGAGTTAALGQDWSRELGPLEPGEYALLLQGMFLDRKGVGEGETIYLPLRFTLTEDDLPEGPGPSEVQQPREGISAELTMLSPHRYIQTIRIEEGRYVPERDYSLFRVEKDGALTYVLPRYRLPVMLNYPVTYGRQNGGIYLDVDLAAQYGVLQPGTYVVRRRLYRLEEGESSPGSDQSWRTLPEDRLLYADSYLYLNGYLAAPAREVEPGDLSFYAGEDPEVPVTILNSRFTSTECRFAVKNLGDKTISIGTDEDTLYYLDRNGEWLPVAMRHHFSHGLVAVEIAPGESKEWGTDYGDHFRYGALPKGTYRMVFTALVLGQTFDEPYTTGLLVVEFSIREDGTGTYNGLMQEVETAVRACRSRLAEAYVLPEKPEDALPDTWFDPIGHDDPYVRQWEIGRHQGRIRVTVYRDRDVERAKQLLADFPTVEVLRGEDVRSHVSPATEENAGTLGTLRAELLEQTDPELYREGTWLLTLEIRQEDVWLHPDCLKGLFPEVWDREKEQWIALTETDWSSLAVYWDPVYLPPGTELTWIVCLGHYHTEFSPDKEYRFAAAVDVGDWETRIEYYTCPFVITEAGQA